MLVNLDETSTGQLYDIQLLSDFCKRNHMYLAVDAISTFLCDEYKMDEWGIDATILSSQKGLCLSPGMAMVVLNKRILDNKVLKNDPRSIYFDFKDYIKNMERGQTPFTPAVGLVYELYDILSHIQETGLDNWLGIIKNRADYFRGRLYELGAKVPDYPISNAVTPMIFEQPVANVLFNRLKDEHEIYVNPTGGEMSDYLLRIAHVGDLEIKDYDELIGKMKKILSEIE